MVTIIILKISPLASPISNDSVVSACWVICSDVGAMVTVVTMTTIIQKRSIWTGWMDKWMDEWWTDRQTEWIELWLGVL